MLDLEELDRDIFRGVNPNGDGRRPRLFGGQVAAQAARAASLTVPDDRSIHSLHGYFLRAGQADRPTILHVDRDRDGGRSRPATSPRVQDGEVIMSLLVSFHVDEDGPEFQAVDCPTECRARGRRTAAGRSPRTRRCSTSASRTPDARGRSRGGPHRFWARARGPLPDDPPAATRACSPTSPTSGTGLEKLPLERAVVGTEPRPLGLVPPPGAHGRLGARRPRARWPPPAPAASTPAPSTTATAGCSRPSPRST